MSVWIVRLDAPGAGPRLAVKDALDVRGLPTTAGCRAVADTAQPATADAACVATARAAGAGIVGKTTLDELCYGVTGVNPWFGTPVNPLDPTLVPGGSSSGSTVAVAIGEADVGLGTDTGGSVRIPAACCGIVGLKTTWGRVPLAGVWPLAPTLDTVGPLARDMAGLVTAMGLIEPGFTPAGSVTRVGRVRRPGVLSAYEAALDQVLAAWGVRVVEVELAGWDAADEAFETLIAAEAYRSNRHLADAEPSRMSEDKRARVLAGAVVTAGQVAAARAARDRWRAEIASVLQRLDVLALPTLSVPVLPLADAGRPRNGMNAQARVFNVSGNPALTLPLGGPGVAVQLVGPDGGEELLCAAGLVVEAAHRSSSAPPSRSA